MLLPEALSKYVVPLIIRSNGGTPSVTVKVRKLVAPRHALPDPEKVAAVGVEPTVIVIDVPRLAGTQLLASLAAVRV